MTEGVSFVVQSSVSQIRKFVFPIVKETDENDAKPIGTAVWICYPLLLTARHNIEFILNRNLRNVSGNEETKGFAVRFYQVLEGPEYQVWEANEIWCSGEADLAIVKVKLIGYTGDRPYLANDRLAFRACMPRVSSRIAGFGYHSIVSNTSEKKTGLHLELNSTPQATTGSVKEVFHEKRDGGMYSFPCFQVDARFDPGMSGGPVFDENGHVVGIICGSLPGNENEDCVSYCSAIWPFLRISVDCSIVESIDASDCRAIDLALSKQIEVIDLNEINPSLFPDRTIPR